MYKSVMAIKNIPTPTPRLIPYGFEPHNEKRQARDLVVKMVYTIHRKLGLYWRQKKP
ncbi:hypothetical protein QUF87_20765 [Lysinibacillus pakistanensis]|nr:hypothetical protein [Lysinibacillus pakistanensis]